MKSRLLVLVVAVAVAVGGYLWWVATRPAPVLSPVAPPADVTAPDAPEAPDQQ